jgi:hypothetical protein
LGRIEIPEGAGTSPEELERIREGTMPPLAVKSLQVAPRTELDDFYEGMAGSKSGFGTATGKFGGMSGIPVRAPGVLQQPEQVISRTLPYVWPAITVAGGVELSREAIKAREGLENAPANQPAINFPSKGGVTRQSLPTFPETISPVLPQGNKTPFGPQPGESGFRGLSFNLKGGITQTQADYLEALYGKYGEVKSHPDGSFSYFDGKNYRLAAPWKRAEGR